MTSIDVDSRTFVFPDGWLVMKYDDTPYYKKQFQGIDRTSRGGMKAVDLIALKKADGVMYLIESKDYRVKRRSKEISPHEEFIQKVLDTLTGIIPTALCSYSSNPGEKVLLKQMRMAKKLRLVFQFEQPQKTSHLRPSPYDIADIQSFIRTKLRSIDPHALVIDSKLQYKVEWDIK